MPYHMLKYIPYDTVYGVLVNGLRHWLAGCKILEKELQQESIISFDFSEDKFKQMHLSKAFLKNSTYCFARTVGVLDECICVVDGVWEPRYQLEIWVMQDYGVPESWTKRFIIPQTQARQPFGLNPLRVVWSFRDGKILLLEDKKKLVLYDTKQDTMTSSSATIHGAENYVESLVSLNSGIYVGSCREYANILSACWTKKLRLFNYDV
ncbi:F-box protein CPR1-like [Papaver somniferum]|uniref:F-box protein CPR1-like n=1 Tax=Papaver somniferum TaxID=3469 RepID=UPI000E700D50|nr:F-box protein CPR1-like [Papaver somniferum]